MKRVRGLEVLVPPTLRVNIEKPLRPLCCLEGTIDIIGRLAQYSHLAQKIFHCGLTLTVIHGIHNHADILSDYCI
jgi:hypothetical protein